MALTATEQLQLINGSVTPPNTDLQSLILQVGAIKAEEFYTSYKDFFIFDVDDLPINTDAKAYLDKFLRACDSIFNGQIKIANLTRAMVVLIGKSAVTMPQIQGATQEQWETFLSANMDKAIELFSRIRKAEKVAYNAL
jgi:hypothetical protein